MNFWPAMLTGLMIATGLFVVVAGLQAIKNNKEDDE